jgi:localization factor PodJL
LAHSLAHSQDELKGDIARTHNALDQVHGTLGELVGRLAAIEQSIRSETRTAAAAQAPAYADAGHEGQYAHDPYAHDPSAHEEAPFELTHAVGKVAVRLVEDAAPGMSAFDGMLPPRSAEAAPAAQAEPVPVEPMPVDYAPVEPEAIAPPIQPEHAPMMAAPAPDATIDTDPMGHADHLGHADYVDHMGHLGDFDHVDHAEPAEQAEAPHAPLPRAPQLEAQIEALRAQAAQAHASEVQTPQAQAPQFEAPYAEPPRAEAPPPKRMAAGHGPINPDLPPDEPLEPGTGLPILRAHPSARIAATDAEFGHDGNAADAPAGDKLSFIAAARRAAQAAMQQEPATPSSLDTNYLEDAPEAAAHPLRQRVMRRVKSLFVAASIVAIVVGSVQMASTYFKFGKSGAPATRTMEQHLDKTSERADTGPATADRGSQAAGSTAAITAPSQIAATPLALVPPSASIDLLAPPDQPVHVTTMPAPDPRRATQPTSNSASKSTSKDASSADITGSIPKVAKRPASAPAVASSGLPVAIGGPRLRQAAAAGNAAAAYEVAMRFAEGRGVPANLATAARWYERAANKGVAPAEFRLASLFEKGQGVKKDLARARALYFAAARQGHAKAMHNLAVLYAEGVDGKPDYTTAVQWFRDAADHGVSDSQYNLGVLYARGIGVEKDLAESYKWFALAAKHGDKEAARKRDEIASHLDKKALAAVRLAVAKFVPKPQPRQATTVPAPPGGWDKTAAAPATRRTARAADASAAGKR